MITDEMIERVERGEGADRELDGKIVRALSGSKDHWFPFAGGFMTEQTAPALTDSIDTVVALIEAKLPGAYASIEMGVWGKSNLAEVAIETAEEDRAAFRGEATSPARALLAATLRALRALQGDRT